MPLRGHPQMTDPRITKLANLLVHYCTDVRPGDWVVIRSHVEGLPLVEETVRAVTLAGAHPTVLLENEGVVDAFAHAAADAQLGWASPLEKLVAEKADVRISIDAATNTRTLTSLPPARAQQLQRGRRAFQQTMMQRAAAGDFRWVLTLFPCAAYAQEAEMSLREYEDFVYAATAADQPDPVAHWQRVHERQQRLVEWLRGKQQVTVRGPNVDLHLSIAGRTFMNSDGRRNMPSGEIYTGPVEDSVNGWVRFTYPALRAGRAVEGVEFTFVDGAVVEAHAAKGEDFLLATLDTDPGARFLGEFAIGTNDEIQRFTRNILFDEKIGGAMHMAVGAGYPETGSRNKSTVHWDFICDMRTDSEIRVDGELFYKDGKFALEGLAQV